MALRAPRCAQAELIATEPSTTGDRRGPWALRDRPVVGWLLLAALVALTHPFVPGSRWLMVHLVLLGALTHSIMVWSTHFSQALLKTRPGLDDRRARSGRLWLLLVGTATTLVGVPTGRWPLTLIGAVLVGLAVTLHAVQLARRLRAALPGRFRVTVRYYLAAALCLPVGAGLGAALALGLPASWHGRLVLAHVTVNVLGWVGLTVAGTLLTLWPTMLRTRIAPAAERRATQALPGFLVALVLVLIGTVLDQRWLSTVALLGYALALAWWAGAVLAPARSAPPREFAPASVGAALIWWVAGLIMVIWQVAGARTWTDVAEGLDPVVPVLAVGFAAQLLTGALSYLVPSVLGGGRSVVRAGQRWLDRWGTARLVTINLGVALFLLPVPGPVRNAVAALVLVALIAFLPLMLLGVRAAVTARGEAAAARVVASAEGAGAPVRAAGPVQMPSVWSGSQLAAALGALALAVSLGVAAAAGTGSPVADRDDVQVVPTGRTTTVRVEAQDMRFEPARITVPAGDRLVVDLVNVDETTVHDLQILDARTPRLAPGEVATLDVGVVGAATQGWCTVVGHRQLGMVLEVAVVAEGTTAAPDPGSRDGAETGVREAVDPVLPPLSTPAGTVHQLTLTATEVELEVAPGVTQVRWTFDGQVPGPTLRGRVGDTFRVTLVNDGTIGHSIDFHAGALAPDEPMRTIAPGESLDYTFTAERAGVWMYHCSTMPVSSHIAAGMHGAVIIEPDGLPRVDREYLVVQSEVYLAAGTGAGEVGASDVDPDAVAAERPAFVTFNGIADQYDRSGRMFPARVGERVRFWVLDAGPNRALSFHVVGGQFDTVWSEGGYRLGPAAERVGAQALGLHPSQGGFVELTFPEAGHYPVVSHLMVDAERGARGIVQVRP